MWINAPEPGCYETAICVCDSIINDRNATNEKLEWREVRITTSFNVSVASSDTSENIIVRYNDNGRAKNPYFNISA